MEELVDNRFVITLEAGEIVIELLPEVAPRNAERLQTLAREGEYDDVAFHRVIEGFVAQAGDVQYGDLSDGYDPALVGSGSSGLGRLPAEFSGIPFERGVVGMARAADPEAGPGQPERQIFLDSADAQFFIMLDRIPSLDGDYTVVGRVVDGMEVVDGIQRTTTGAAPDRMLDVEAPLSREEAREVALLYETGLDRDGEIDLEGLNYWIDIREGGFSVEETAQSFLDSREFQEKYGDPDALSDLALVERLYRNVLNREGEAEGVAFWTGVLEDQGFSRANLLYAFAVSVENADTLDFVETLTETAPGDWEFVGA